MTCFLKSAPIAAVFAVAMPLAGVADTITIDNTFNATSLSIFGDPALYEAVTIGGDNPMSVYAGGFHVTSTSDESFIAWCIELAENLRLEATYDLVASPFSADATDNLSRLFTGFVDTIETGIQAAGFQVAIWELISDAQTNLDDGVFTLVQGSGSYTSQAVYDAADGYLTGLSAFDAGYDLSFLVQDGTQDLITGMPSVPLPASGLLLIAGLGALGWGARKRA